jgi:hypothetical protein
MSGNIKNEFHDSSKKQFLQNTNHMNNIKKSKVWTKHKVYKKIQVTECHIGRYTHKKEEKKLLVHKKLS